MGLPDLLFFKNISGLSQYVRTRPRLFKYAINYEINFELNQFMFSIVSIVLVPQFYRESDKLYFSLGPQNIVLNINKKTLTFDK